MNRKKRKKNRSLPPRRKRMDRPGRLQSAKHWLKSIRHARPAGRRLVRRYAKWYGVDRLCALTELELLEIPIDPVDAERVREEAARPGPKKRKKERALRKTRELLEVERPKPATRRSCSPTIWALVGATTGGQARYDGAWGCGRSVDGDFPLRLRVAVVGVSSGISEECFGGVTPTRARAERAYVETDPRGSLTE